MTDRYAAALTTLDRHRDELGTTADARDKYLLEIRKAFEWLNDRQPEDFRLAATMAVDSAKSLLSIAIAVFVALGGFIQYGLSHDLHWWSASIIFLGAGEILAVLSMVFGFNAIGKAFKRGEGREAIGQIAWSTEPLRSFLQWQSYLGLGTLVAFGFAIIFWQPSSTPVAFSVGPAALAQTGNANLRFEGQWSSLLLRQGNLSITLGPVPSGQTASFEVHMP
jgi:hypothetical protein